MKCEFRGVNGRRVAIDMSKVESILEEDGETHVFTSSDWYKVRDPYDAVMAKWQETIA